MGGARGEPSYFKEGNVCCYAPELNYTNFKQKNLCKAPEKHFFHFCVKVSPLHWVQNREICEGSQKSKSFLFETAFTSFDKKFPFHSHAN